jgi:hypothetical protein
MCPSIDLLPYHYLHLPHFDLNHPLSTLTLSINTILSLLSHTLSTWQAQQSITIQITTIMRLTIACVLCSSIAGVRCAGAARPPFNLSSYAGDDTIVRDVAIIGGGSAGCHAAVTFSDLGKSVIVMEKAPLLGGHTNTYVDPGTGSAVDYGVKSFWNLPATTEYLDRLGIPYTTNSPAATYDSTTHFDFNTNQQLVNFTGNSNLSGYADQLARFPYLDQGLQLPDPVPSDLSLLFSDFVTKYSLQDEVSGLRSFFGWNLLDKPTLNVISEAGTAALSSGLPGNALRVLSDTGIRAIYNRVSGLLGDNILLQSSVTAAQRPFGNDDASETRLVVQTPGGTKLIVASKLFITIPTVLDNMAPFDLDARERGIFQQFSSRGFYVGLVNATSLPPGVRFESVGTDTTYNLRKLPGVRHLTPIELPGIYRFYFDSEQPIPESQVRAQVLASVEALQNAVVGKAIDHRPEIIAFSSHSPWRPGVGGKAIANGFWSEMYSLQGYRNTWYNGMQFVPDSPGIWNYTVSLAPQIIAAL